MATSSPATETTQLLVLAQLQLLLSQLQDLNAQQLVVQSELSAGNTLLAQQVEAQAQYVASVLAANNALLLAATQLVAETLKAQNDLAALKDSHTPYHQP